MTINAMSLEIFILLKEIECQKYLPIYWRGNIIFTRLEITTYIAMPSQENKELINRTIAK